MEIAEVWQVSCMCLAHAFSEVVLFLLLLAEAVSNQIIMVVLKFIEQNLSASVALNNAIIK